MADHQERFELHDRGSRQQHKAGQQVRRADAGRMGRDDHRAGDHDQRLSADQQHDDQKILQIQPAEKEIRVAEAQRQREDAHRDARGE
jgi:hypothetical protein